MTIIVKAHVIRCNHVADWCRIFFVVYGPQWGHRETTYISVNSVLCCLRSKSSTQFSFVGGAWRGAERRRWRHSQLGPRGWRRHDPHAVDRHDHWTSKSEPSKRSMWILFPADPENQMLMFFSAFFFVVFRPIMRTGYTVWKWNVDPDTQRQPRLLDL